tara:strand:- start:117 stop:1799 length:1683 start_codon:yes stop_codon:yes gene_type:complete
MRIKWIPRKHKNKTYKYPFIVHSFRNKDGKPRDKIFANLHGVPQKEIEAIDLALRSSSNGNEPNISIDKIKFNSSIEMGPAWAILSLMEQLGIMEELGRVDSISQTALKATIIDRVINPKPFSTQALYRLFDQSATRRLLNDPVKGSLNKWYVSFEKIYEKQMEIQKSLFKRNHEEGGRIILYDITSSYFEGHQCPLAKYGYNRDGKKGKMQIVFGVITDEKGQPIAVKVFNGNTKDETTVINQIKELRDEFGIEELVFVGDRGMITSHNLNTLKTEDYSEWLRYITAIKRSDMMDMVENETHPIQIGLFDKDQLVEVCEKNIRYVLCHNPLKKEEDALVRQRLIDKTEAKLLSIQKQVATGRLKNKDKIAKRLYTWINKWNVGRFFEVNYDEAEFSYTIKEEEIKRYSNLDGCYVITSTLDKGTSNADELLSRYKSLSLVEQVFRTMKTTDINVRPIRKWNEERVKGYIFVCMLAYLIIWKSRQKLSDFLVRDPKTKECIGGSLKEIWEALKSVQLGCFQFGPIIREKISTIGAYQKQILKALDANITSASTRILSLRN